MELVKSALDSILDKILVINIDDFTIIAANKALLDQTQLSEKEICCKKCFEIFHKKTAPCTSQDIVCPIIQMKKAGKAVIVEQTHLDKHGNPQNVEIAVTPIQETEDQPTKAVFVIKDISERKKCEAALVNTDNILRALMDNTPDAVYFKDDTFHYAKANKAYATRLGIENPELLVGKTVFDLYDKEDAETINSEDQKLIADGKPITDLVKPVALPDGKTMWTSTSKALIKSETGETMGIVGISRDVTERKKISEQLRTSEKRFREMLDNMLEGCQLIGHDWRYLYVNDVLAKQTRVPKEKLLGRTMMEVFPGIENTQLFINLQKCMAQRTPLITENEFAFPDGNKGLFNLSMLPVHEGLFVLSIDITESRKAEEELRKEREMLEAVTGNMNAGLVIISKDYKILWANKFLAEYLGSDIKGKACYRKLANMTQICPGCVAKQIFEGGKDLAVNEQQVETPAGPIWLEITAIPIRDQNGKVTAVSELSINITERKNAEATLKLAEEKYRKLFEEGMDAIFVADTETGIILDCNNAAAQLIGRPKSELIGMHQRFLHPPEYSTDGTFTEGFKRDLIAQERHPSEGQVITKNGEIKDVTVKSNIVEISGKKLMQGIFRDITERKRVEKQLRDFAYRLNGLPSSGCFLMESHERCFKAYADLTFHGLPNLCIVREDPDKLVRDYGIKPESIRLLSSKPLKDYKALPDLQTLSFAISEFLKANKAGVILLDGLEYLTARFTFEPVYRFLQEKRFDILENGALLIMPVNILAFNDKEKAFLSSEIKVINHAITLPSPEAQTA